jgi:Fuc2NAc and GlcNAc transferase
MTFTAILLSTCLLGWLGAWIVSLLAPKLGLVDRPTSRSSHSQPTPRGGGIGIFAAFLLSALLSGIPAAVYLPLSALTMWALLGDFLDISPKLRLVGQLFWAAVIVSATCQAPPSSYTFWISLVFWTIFLVGTANFYNFMDGINGIAGITGFLGFALLAGYFSVNLGPTPLSLVALSISLGALGFLPLNMPKARVFMGDVGSILLGGAFACLVYLASETLLDFICLTACLFPFYADELTTMAVRLRDGENLTQPHRRHLYQLLANERHMPHWQVTLGYAVFQLLVSLSIFLIKPYGIIMVLSVLGCYFILFSLATYWVRKGFHAKQLFCRTISRTISSEREMEEVEGTLERAYPLHIVPVEITAELSTTKKRNPMSFLKSGKKSFPGFDRVPQTEGASREAPYLDKA